MVVRCDAQLADHSRHKKNTPRTVVKRVPINIDLLRASNEGSQLRVKTQSGEGGGGCLDGLWALVAHLSQPVPSQKHLPLSPLRLVPPE